MEENYLKYKQILIISLIIFLAIYWLNRHYQENFGSLRGINCLKKNRNPDTLYIHLKFIDRILTKYRIKHWLMYGTLLGAVRQNDIIPFDYDFDLGAFVQDADKIMSLNRYIEKFGYKFYKPEYYSSSCKKNIWRVSIKIKYKGRIMGDIYLYHKFNDGYMRRFDPKSGTYFWPKGTFPSWYINRLEKVRIRNQYFPGPRKPKTLLKHWYGETWKTPIKAQAQGGTKIKGYDFYGGSLDQELVYFNSRVPTIDIPIKCIYPETQKEWVNRNEIIIL